MYWYKKKNIGCKAVIAIAVTALFLSCISNPDGNDTSKETYVDIPKYFKAEITRLKQENPVVEKTVVKDSLSETKELQIADWENELASFASIDLNKPAYAGVLKKDSTANKTTITSSDPKTDIAVVEITYDQRGAPTEFQVRRHIHNALYKTKETLHYIKGKKYSLEKQQSVLILGDKYYRIEGIFKP